MIHRLIERTITMGDGRPDPAIDAEIAAASADARADAIAADLSRRGVKIKPRDVRRWPADRLAGAALWIDLYDRTNTPSNGFDLPTLDDFLAAREILRPEKGAR